MTAIFPTRVFPGLLIVAALLAAGCGKGGVHSVSGEVTLDGTPIKTGQIRFIPTAGPPVGGEIKDGRYSVVLPPGQARVEISASVVTGRRKAYDTPDSPMIDITKEAVPAKYNTSSTLTYTVEPNSNTKSFELTTK